MLARSFTVSLACAALAFAQSASLTVPPAAETLAAKITPAELPLFDGETIQLTDDVVATLLQNPDLAEYASLYEFEDSSNSTLSVRARRGALEKIVPIGSSCYKKSEYDNCKCTCTDCM